MLQILKVLFDGTTLHPTEPLNGKSGTKVQITIDAPLPKAIVKSKSFLQTVRWSPTDHRSSMCLEGPTDWSENLDQYLYGEEIP